MPDPIVVVDSSEIAEGSADAVKEAFEKLAAFVKANEAEPLAYGVYLDEDGRRVTVLQIHPSSDAVEHHMEVAGPLFREFAGLLTLVRVDVYGQPSEALLAQLRSKAQLLGDAPVRVHALHAGFTRFGPTGRQPAT